MMKKRLIKRGIALLLAAVMASSAIPVLAAPTSGDLVFSAGEPPFIYQITDSASGASKVKLVQMAEMLPEGGSYANYTGNYVIPETVLSSGGIFGGEYAVTEIAGSNPLADPGAFSGMPLTGVTIPKTVQSIGARAFADCQNLQRLSLSSSTMFIASDAFAGTTQRALTRMELTLRVSEATAILTPTSYQGSTGRTVTLPKSIDSFSVSAPLTISAQCVDPVDLELSGAGSVVVNTGAVLSIKSFTGDAKQIRVRPGGRLLNLSNTTLVVTNGNGTTISLAPGVTLIGANAGGAPDPLPGTVNRPRISVNFGGTVAVQQSGRVVLITPFEGYHVKNVVVNGVSMGEITHYTFLTASRENTIKVTFAEGKSTLPNDDDSDDPEKKPEVDPSLLFTDVSKDDWYLDAIAFMVKNKIFLGVSDTRFAPRASVSRAMFVTVLHRLVNYDDKYGLIAEEPMSFPDVEKTAWYADAVGWAAALDLTDGVVTANQFQPSAILTREQFAMILFNFTHALGYDTVGDETLLDRYSDGRKISPLAREAMAWAVNNGYITGKTETLLDPLGNISRAETSAILMRYLQNS